jgi:hypothetical protein
MRMPKRLTISLPEGLREFVEEQVAAGDYSTARRQPAVASRRRERTLPMSGGYLCR